MSNYPDNTENSENNKRKDTFLLEMYKEQFKHIDRHINLSWQSVGIIIIIGGLIVGTYKFDVPIIISSILMIMIISWNIAKLYDSNHWYERHIHIVSNIENHFLDKCDSINIHPYFSKIRGPKDNLEWIVIQKIGLYCTWIFAILFYIFGSKAHESNNVSYNFDIGLLLLSFVSILLLLILSCYNQHNKIAINKLRDESPGKNRESQKDKELYKYSNMCKCLFITRIKILKPLSVKLKEFNDFLFLKKEK